MAQQFSSRPKDPFGEKQSSMKWWVPVVGLIVGVALLVFAMMIAIPLREAWWKWDKMSDLRMENDIVFVVPNEVKQVAAVCYPGIDADFCWGKVDLGVALIIFMSVFGVGMVVIFAFVGMDPAEKEARDVTFQAMKRKEEERRRKKKGERKKTYKR
jgi:protein-S-isoprenylcysteine O-methyltransferase Ste14